MRAIHAVPVVAGAGDGVRGPYRSTAILRRLAARPAEGVVRLLAVPDRDLYGPVLAFVFGEDRLAGPCAIVPFHRPGEDTCGLSAKGGLLLARLPKEAAHELRRTFGLRHHER